MLASKLIAFNSTYYTVHSKSTVEKKTRNKFHQFRIVYNIQYNSYLRGLTGIALMLIQAKVFHHCHFLPTK